MNNIILKTYEDERINKELKKCLVRAVADDEFDMRYDLQCGMTDFKILLDNIDKIVDYANNGYKGELRLNSNIWEVCLETLSSILDLYGLEWENKETRKVTEAELVIPKSKVGVIKEKIFNKMIEYGWHLDENRYKDFEEVFNIHSSFIESSFDKIEESDINTRFDMNSLDFQSFYDMVSFMSDFIRALNDIDEYVIRGDE